MSDSLTRYSPPTTLPAPKPVSTTTSTTAAPSDGVTDYQRAIWLHVSFCEEGPGTPGWATDGPRYSGGLGFTHANWDQFNTFGYPSDAAEASPEEQIRVAVAFAIGVYHNADANPEPSLTTCGNGY